MSKIQDEMSMHERTVQKLAADAEEVRIPKPRRRRKERKHPVDTSPQTRRKSVKLADKLFHGVHDDVYETAMRIADQNWRRLEVIDSTTVVVHNNEVH